MKQSSASLHTPDDALVALESVAIEAHMEGVLSNVTVTQIFRNRESVNTEVAYTFPLPCDAVLLELEIHINGEVLRGTVASALDAEGRYEDALGNGDSAVLVSELEPGLYHLAIGNLMPGETMVVKLRFARLHSWQGDDLRFLLPTTLAPRFGDPLAAGLQPHEVPEHVLDAGYRFSLELHIHGELARCDFECPSHPIRLETGDDGHRIIRLAGTTAQMDRDFVLVLKRPGGDGSFATAVRDGNGFVALASFHPHLPPAKATGTAPRCITLVVDCSGSMSGDSIEQARLALGSILDQFTSDERFNLIRFGNHAEALFPRPAPVDAKSLARAREWLNRLQADLGGTRMDKALDKAYRNGHEPGMPNDILLITDGEIWHGETLLSPAAVSGMRIFAVGVGSAVNLPLLQSLADATAGAVEQVAPREGMAEHIMRIFGRMRQPRARSAQVEWPRPARAVAPTEHPVVFSGDTLHLFAWFDTLPEGDVRLHLELEDGSRHVLHVPITSHDSEHAALGELPRIAARARLPLLPLREQVEIALRYQLTSEHTRLILVKVREENTKADSLPELRTVPHTLAAGWGGFGSVSRNGVNTSMLDQSNSDMLRYSTMSSLETRVTTIDMDTELDFLDEPDHDADAAQKRLERQRQKTRTKIREFCQNLAKLEPASVAALSRIDELETLGLDAWLLDILRRELNSRSGKVSESRIVHGFLHTIAQHCDDVLPDNHLSVLYALDGGEYMRFFQRLLG